MVALGLLVSHNHNIIFFPGYNTVFISTKSKAHSNLFEWIAQQSVRAFNMESTR